MPDNAIASLSGFFYFAVQGCNGRKAYQSPTRSRRRMHAAIVADIL